MSDTPETTVDLQFRAVVVKSERNGQAGAFRAVVPDQNGALALDLSAVLPGDRVRDVQIDDYAEIFVRIRKKDLVEAELAAQQATEATPPVPAENKSRSRLRAVA